MIGLLMGILVVLFVAGFPMVLPMVMAPVAVLIAYFPNVDLFIASQQLSGGIQSFVLLAVPMFIFAADIMCAGYSSRRLLDFVQTFIGHIHGGLAITAATACTMFGAISGSTQATVVAIGKPMHERLCENGYNESQSIGLIISSAIIAMLIPPSICMIMYCVVTGSSVGDLFIAGIVPGLLILTAFSVFCYIDARRNGYPLSKKATARERLNSFKRALPPLGFPVIIFVGIYTGFFSPTEAAAASVLYAVVLEVLVYRTVKPKDLYHIALSTGVVTSSIFILIAAGSLFSWVLSYAKLPQVITGSLLGADPSKLHILIIVTICFFIGCMFVDTMVVIYVVTPIFFPIAMSAGIDPIHMGIIVTLQAAIGSVTPPFGCNIFTACAIFDRPFITVIRKLAPYIIMLLLISVLIILVPGLSTCLL